MDCYARIQRLSVFLPVFLLILAYTVQQTATDESVPPLRTLPIKISDEEMMNTNKRFQQIMQGRSQADASWNQVPKVKGEKIDVKAEIEKLNISYVYQSNWPAMTVKLGQVTAVSFDKAGNVVIFHRVDRIWGPDSFDLANNYRQRKKGPIRSSAVLALTPKTGDLVYDWGKNLFYMPHGLTVDKDDNVWVTDVALHQVFKFGPRGSNDEPLMTFGTAFMPGNSDTKFCKPTSVAVLDNGDFFIADGYCNARIMKYTKNGEKILTWGQNSFSGSSYNIAPKNFFAIPHALTLVPKQQLICVADRENGRVQCFYWSNGTFHSQYHNPIIGDRLFSMAYTPAEGGRLMIVNGPDAELGYKTDQYNAVLGFVLDMQTEKVVSKFGPNDLTFQNPHDVAVTNDGNEIYVAELDPMRIHKFVHKNVSKSLSLSVTKPTETSGVGPAYELETAASLINKNNNNKNMQLDPARAIMSTSQPNDHTTHTRPGGTAILVSSLMLLFAFFTFAMAWLIARRRKRGCLPFGSQNRRHAWDFPTKPEGFKLGGLLMDRGKRSGFEKLDQNASDEETDATTNMFNNTTPFA